MIPIPVGITIEITPQELQQLAFINTTWPILLIAVIILGGLQVLEFIITPEDAKNITHARLFGGVLCLVQDAFGGVRLVRGIPSLDGRALESKKDSYFFTATSQPNQGTDDFTAINSVVKQSSILRSIGKPILLGFDTTGIALNPDLVLMMQKLTALPKDGKDPDKTIKAELMAKIQERFKGVLAEKKMPVWLELTTLSAMATFIKVNFGAEILGLLEAKYERRGQFGKPGGLGSIGKVILIIVIGIIAFILFIVFVAPMISGGK